MGRAKETFKPPQYHFIGVLNTAFSSPLQFPTAYCDGTRA